MLKKLSVLPLLMLMTACNPDYSDITETKKLLATNGYHTIKYRYTVAGSSTKNVSVLCNYNTTIVYTAKNNKNQVKNLAVCLDTKKIHLLK